MIDTLHSDNRIALAKTSAEAVSGDTNRTGVSVTARKAMLNNAREVSGNWRGLERTAQGAPC